MREKLLIFNIYIYIYMYYIYIKTIKDNTLLLGTNNGLHQYNLNGAYNI